MLVDLRNQKLRVPNLPTAYLEPRNDAVAARGLPLKTKLIHHLKAINSKKATKMRKLIGKSVLFLGVSSLLVDWARVVLPFLVLRSWLGKQIWYELWNFMIDCSMLYPGIRVMIDGIRYACLDYDRNEGYPAAGPVVELHIRSFYIALKT